MTQSVPDSAGVPAGYAARKVFDAELGLCPSTKLKKLFLGQAQVSDVDALLRRNMTEDGFRKELRFLVPQILMIAQYGDQVACDLLSEFAEQIVNYIEAGFRKMKMHPEEREKGIRESASVDKIAC